MTTVIYHLYKDMGVAKDVLLGEYATYEQAEQASWDAGNTPIYIKMEEITKE